MAVKRHSSKKANVVRSTPKKAAPKKAIPKKTAPKKASPKASAKKAAPKKAVPVRLSDMQKTILKQVADTQAVGLLATKATAKTLTTLQAKKLIKKGKKAKGSTHVFVYHLTKAGARQLVLSEGGLGGDTDTDAP